MSTTDVSSVSASVDSLMKNMASDQPFSVSAQVNADGTGIVADSSTTKGTSSGTNTSDALSTATKQLGEQDFLQLLMAQLQYQDPLNPMDNSQMVAQLAQFSALEGTNNVAKSVNNLNDSFKSTVDAQKKSADSMASTAAVSLIGKTARMQVKDLKWGATAGETVDIPVYIGANDSATVQIEDSTGTVVRTFDAANKDAQNTVGLTWDGRTDSGDIAAAGDYTVHIVGQENDSSLYAFVEDTVTGVRFTNDNAMVKIHGMEIPLSNVLDVAMGSGNAQSQVLTPSSAVSLIGKTVRVKQEGITWSAADNASLGIKVNASAGSTVNVTLGDAAGNAIKTLSGTADGTGVAFLTWNGVMDSGQYAPAGNYAINIAGSNINPSLYAFIDGSVQGVTNLSGSSPQIRIAGTNFDLSDIVDISDGTGTSG